MSPTLVQSIALVIFVVAILHTFSVKFFKSLAQKFPRHHNIFEMLGEVEIVFGFWGMGYLVKDGGPRTAMFRRAWCYAFCRARCCM